MIDDFHGGFAELNMVFLIHLSAECESSITEK